MDAWMKLKGKKVFLRTIHNRTYEGIIEEVNCDDKPLIFISLIDKNQRSVMFNSSEIAEIKEEE